MLSVIKQTFHITLNSLGSIQHRWRNSVVLIAGVAGVAAVLTSVLSMSEGFRSVLVQDGRDDRAIILSNTSSAELTSNLSRAQTDTIAAAPGIRKGANGTPLASREVIVVAELPQAGSGAPGNAEIRGVQPTAFQIRNEVSIIQGRMFGLGSRELIVGREATHHFSGLTVGSQIVLRGVPWKVVGVFAADAGAHESELWADAEVVEGEFRHTGYQSIIVSLDGKTGLSQLSRFCELDNKLPVKLRTLREYFSSQAASMTLLIRVLGYTVGAIMSVGALFGALNSMYAAVAARTKEIAILRALGFGTVPIILSVLLEAAFLGLTGGLAGILAADALFNGYTAATLGADFSQVVFAFRVTPPLMAHALLIALAIGLVGGLIPAVSAARLPVISALRMTR